MQTLTETSLSGADIVAYIALLLLAALSILFFVERPRHDSGVHSPKLAWIRGGSYTCAAIVIGWLAGVLDAALTPAFSEYAGPGNVTWVVLTAVCVGTVLWGYVYWWPKGTLQYDRPSHPIAAGVFGVFWGLGSGLLQLTLFAMVATTGLGRAATAVAVYLLFAIFNLNLQSGWWDIHVSPPHNIRAWNARKVLFAHNPFLIATLAHYTLFDQAIVLIALQSSALACAAIAMHFPPFWAADGTMRVSHETALGE